MAIVIIVANISDIIYLYAKNLRFGGALKVVEKYWEAGSGSICLICYDIGNNCPENYGDRPAKCSLYAKLHKLEEHKCGMRGYRARWDKICAGISTLPNITWL